MEVSGCTLVACLYAAAVVVATVIIATVSVALMWLITHFISMRRSRAKLQLLVKNDTALYLTKRVENLRFFSHRLAKQVHWHVPTNENKPALDVEKFLRERQYPAQDQAAIVNSIKRLGDYDTRLLSLEGLICRLLVANISLGGSPVWTMLNPVYIALANVVLGGGSPHPFRIWIWKKARVRLMNILEPRYTRYHDALEDLKEEPPNKAAIASMKLFIEELLYDWLYFDEGGWDTLNSLCRFTVRIGLAMHKDLSPWRWSFEYEGVAGELLPVPKKNRVSEDKIVIYPALLAEGDELGRRYDFPKIIVPAVGFTPPIHDRPK